MDVLNSFLLQQNAEGRTVVLVVDEAQRLESPVLEQIRLISNLETDREKLIQIVLAGQPELGQILNRNEMRQLNQRITVRFHLQPMDFEDTRLHQPPAQSGREKGESFFPGGIETDLSIFTGAAAADQRGLRPGASRRIHERYASITYRIAGAAIRDVKKDMPSFRRRLVLFPAILLFVILIIVGGGLYFKGGNIRNLLHSSPPVEASCRDDGRGSARRSRKRRFPEKKSLGLFPPRLAR